MKVIFGLGNPGRTYQNNRHNVGYMVVDIFAENEGLKFKNNKKLEASVASLLIENQTVMLVKPLTFMNNSGLCAAKISAEFDLETSELLIVYDDADLAVGTLRFRLTGTSGGHRGLSSIIACLGSQGLRRLKVGIGRPAENRASGSNESDLADYVLEDFTRLDLSYIEESLPRAVCACRDWVVSGDEYVMKNYNQASHKSSGKARESGKANT